MQRTIALEYNGQKVVSNPFAFKMSVIIDDYLQEISEEGRQLKYGDIRLASCEALKKMFEGTIITDDIIDNEISVPEIKKACNKVWDWHKGIDEKVKNSSSPQPKEQDQEVGG